MPDIFSTDSLVAVVEELRVPNLGLANRYFINVQQDESEEIHFDIENKPRRMAPFVSPLVAGQVVASRGFRTDTFKPAYIKDKRVFHPGRAVKRAMGEKIGGEELSAEQRMELLVAQDLQDQIDGLERRLEWMAAQVLYAGKVVVQAPQYPKAVVDFGRHQDLTINLQNAERWGENGVKPLDSLQDWSDTMVKLTGVGISDVTMTIDAWKVFRADPDVKERLDRYRGNSTIQQDAHNREGLVFQGIVDGFNIYTYSGWGIEPGDEEAQQKTLLPAFTVICTAAPDLVEGTRHFGAILDHDSLQAMPYFPKSWLEQDPSMRYLLLQSAPLLVPYRVNATMRIKVR
ncbi:major capsid protein [Acidovorax facilis]|uniref:major capsid protein n=1 Tax=Acidovorax facilis TaxID=12917 RepID=UPI003D64F9DF